GKRIGWGQVRRRGVVMHHATVSRRFDPAALAALLTADRPRLAAALAARVADLRQAAGRSVPVAELAAAIVASHRAAGLDLCPGGLTARERHRAASLSRDHYAAASWTARR